MDKGWEGNRWSEYPKSSKVKQLRTEYRAPCLLSKPLSTWPHCFWFITIGLGYVQCWESGEQWWAGGHNPSSNPCRGSSLMPAIWDCWSQCKSFLRLDAVWSRGWQDFSASLWEFLDLHHPLAGCPGPSASRSLCKPGLFSQVFWKLGGGACSLQGAVGC